MCGKPCAQSEKTATSPNCKQSSAAQRGRDACGTATRISASLSRRLSAFFGSAPGQDPKAAKFAALPPGHAGFPKRAERSEGSDTTPHPKHHLFRRVCPCVRSFSESRVVYPISGVKANVGHFVDDCAKTIFCRVIPIDGSREGVFATALERSLKSV